MVMLPKNLSNTLTFKSDVVKTGASVLEAELLGEKAYSLGLAANTVQKELVELKAFKGTETERTNLLQSAADAVHSFFVQREMMGFTNHDHPIEFYKIPSDVLSRVGVKNS